MTLLTAISYPFLPSLNGGQWAHVYFHNAITEHVDAIVISSRKNVIDPDKIKFKHIGSFKNRYFTYLPFFQFWTFVKNIKKYNVDFFMCSHPYLGASSILACFLTRVPLVSYSYNIEAIRFKTLGKSWWFLMYIYEMWVMRCSKINFFVTDEDKLYAIEHYKINPNTAFVSPFGIYIDKKPEKAHNANIELKNLYQIPENHKVLYFIGAYGYEPNDDAVDSIIHKICPRLQNQGIDYTILILGGGLPISLIEKIKTSSYNIKYLGFVKDINPILQGADVMLNPMLLGGGIKTKVVEALGNNIKVVSTKNGANGINQNVCQNMLFVSADEDWEGFVENINLACESGGEICEGFYEYYAWNNVTKKVKEIFDLYQN